MGILRIEMPMNSTKHTNHGRPRSSNPERPRGANWRLFIHTSLHFSLCSLFLEFPQKENINLQVNLVNRVTNFQILTVGGTVDEEGNISSAHAPTVSDNRLRFFTWKGFSPRTLISSCSSSDTSVSESIHYFSRTSDTWNSPLFSKIALHPVSFSTMSGLVKTIRVEKCF